MSEVKKIVILFSGSGTNLESIITKLHKKAQRSSEKCHSIEVAAAICNVPTALGIEKATRLHVPTVVLDHKLFDSREAFDTKLVELINSYEPDLVVMAGFMRILTPVFTSNVKAINLHPSLLPKFKGAKAIERSFESDDTQGGVSVHFVTEELDAGELILQESFEKSADETLESFEVKIKEIEHEILPNAIKKLLCS